jgi:hypothetical protein
MSDDPNANVDTGGAGAAATDGVNDLLGEQSAADAVFWYGIYANSMGVGFLLLWVFLNSETWMAWHKDGMLSRIVFYLAAGLAWVMVLFFDGEFMRTVYLDL